MSKLGLIWVGRENRRDPETEICVRYRTRILGFAKLEELVIKPVKAGGEDVVRRQEGQRILDALDPRDYLILCDERGNQETSPGFASLLGRIERQARRPVLVIGGAMGVSDALRQRANFVLSLSKMTLPHALARVVLLEQVYRAFTIKAGHPYHHEG